MPSAIKYIPPTDPERGGYSALLSLERQARRTRYTTALTYYNNNAPEQLDFEDEDSETEPNDNVKINLVRLTADRTVSFLFAKMPRFRTDKSRPDPTPEEIWLTKAMGENGGLNMLTKLGLRGFLAGMTYLRVKKSQDGGYPTITVLDPLAITAYWRMDDVADVLWYENRYMVGPDVYIQDYVKFPEQKEWRIFTYVAHKAADTTINPQNDPNGTSGRNRAFTLDLMSGNDFALVPFSDTQNYALHSSPLPPIIEIGHLPHPDDYYSHGEVDQTDLVDTINRVWSLINRIARKHSEPTDVITGADVDDVEQGDNVMTIAEKDARVQRLEMKGDLTASVETVQKLIETYLATARVVLLRGDVKDLQRVTNASVRTLFIDAIAKNEILRDSYGRGLIKAAKLMMQMSSEPFATTAIDIEVECLFHDALPVDLTEVANQNAIMVPLGARSERTAAEAMGDNWVAEQANMEVEHTADMQKQEEQLQLQQKFAPPPVPGAPGAPGAKKPAGKKPAAKTGKPGAQAPVTKTAGTY